MKYNSDQLLESVLTISEISCTKCDTTDDVANVDDYEACEYFFEEGWRVTPINTYCPNCSKKYLKLKPTP